jgi:hypothetical protein
MKNLLLLLFLAIGAIAHSQVSITSDGSLPDSSSMLDVQSTSKGILIPSMSIAQRDAIYKPATGLLIFCTDDNLFYSNSGTTVAPDWIIVNSKWLSNGSDIHYLGGNVGIGITNPAAKLDVRGTNTDDGAVFLLGNADLSHRLVLFGGRSGDPNPFIQWKQGDPLRFVTDQEGWSEKMRITGDGKVGIGTTLPSAILDIAGGNNWDLVNGDGDFRLGNSQYRIKMGIALGGGGAGAAGIMQYGQPGGYNVLKLGAQGNYLLYINGSTLGVGIGTDSPQASLDIQGSLRIADGSEMAGSILTSDNNGIASWQNPGKHYIGEYYGGGIVFYVYDDGKHGLIAAPGNLNGGAAIQWSNGVGRWTGSTGDGLGAGSMNTALTVAAQLADNPTGNFASRACADFLWPDLYGVVIGDWYLPSKYELNLLFLQYAVVGNFTPDYYWSSTETSDIHAVAQYFGSGQQYDDGAKSYPCKVRAIRAF